MKKANIFHYRWIWNGRMHMMEKQYDLGRSNPSALSRGGLTVGVFLKTSDGLIVDSIENNPEDSFNLVWVVVKCSNKENYNRKKARMIALGRAMGDSFVLTSKNYDWETAKKVSEKLVEKTQEIVAQNRFYHRNDIWATLKNSFNIDSWVENGMESKNANISADVIVARTGN